MDKHVFTSYPSVTYMYKMFNYLRQGGYVFASVSLFVCLSVCHQHYAKKLRTNFYENFRKGPERAKEQSVRFWG